MPRNKPSRNRHRCHHADRKPRADVTDLGLQHCDLVHDEADLSHHAERERSSDRPEPQPAHHLRARNAVGRGACLRSGRLVRPGIDRTDAGRRRADPGEGDRHENGKHDRNSGQHRCLEADMGDKQHQQRRNDDATRACTEERKADRQAAPLHEPRAHHRRDDDRAHADPAERHQRECRVERPRRGCEREQRHRPGKACDSRKHEALQAKARHDLVGEDDDHIADQEGERDCARNQRGRPAVEPLQLDQVDALAVQGEPEDGQRQQETGEHDTPAGVTR